MVGASISTVACVESGTVGRGWKSHGSGRMGPGVFFSNLTGRVGSGRADPDPDPIRPREKRQDP